MRKHLFNGIAFLLFVITAVTLIFLLNKDEPEKEQRGNQTDNFGMYRRIAYNGQDYIEKSGITTILLLGVDKESETVRTGYRSGGQSDFMMLVVIDDKNRTIRELQIDRDTMTDVTILSVLGRETGSGTMQICLAHAFGATEAENCFYSIKAINGLLKDEYIDFYISGTLDSIGVLNEALHGVEVTLTDDFSAYDSAMTKGATLCLTGEQAEILVRSRYYVADGTNEMRMSRQRIYMDAALAKIRTLAHGDTSFISDFVDVMNTCMQSSVTTGRIINELSKVEEYTVMPVEYLSGEHRIGSDGYMEFYADEASVTGWVLDAYYRIDLK